MSRAMIGIDIGAHELKMIQWDGAQIARAVCAPTPEELVKESQITDYNAMADLMKATAKASHIHGRNCAIIIPSRFCYLRRITIPAMTVDQLAVNLPYEFRDFLTQSKESYFYDYALNEMIYGEDGQPQQMDLTACAVPKQLIADYRDMCRRAGFQLQTAIPVECAFSNLIRARNAAPGEDGKPEEFCFVDLGHLGTRIHIFTGPLFENTRESDTGLAGVTRIVSNAHGVELSAAQEQVYANQDNVLYLEDAQELYTAISNDVRKTVNFYEFNHRESDIQELWCCGSGVKNTAMLDTLSQVLGLQIHRMEGILPPAAAGIEQPAVFAAATGAALQ